MDWRALYLSDQGRISRKTFWTAQLVLMGLVLVILMPILVLWSDQALSTPPALGFRIFELVLAALLTWPSHAILAKRLQDRNNSPLWSKVYWGCLLYTSRQSWRGALCHQRFGHSGVLRG